VQLSLAHLPIWVGERLLPADSLTGSGELNRQFSVAQPKEMAQQDGANGLTLVSHPAIFAVLQLGSLLTLQVAVLIATG
jgi:hypothetical protein